MMDNYNSLTMPLVALMQVIDNVVESLPKSALNPQKLGGVMVTLSGSREAVKDDQLCVNVGVFIPK